MSIEIKKDLYIGEVQIVNFLEKLDKIESKVSLLKKNILINENPSCGLEVLNSPAKEINASLDRGKMSQTHFLNDSKEIFDEYTNLIKTVNPFICDDIQGASTWNELLERIATVKSKINPFIWHKGSPFSKGLPTEVLTKILDYLPIDKVASVCKTWRSCSVGVWTRHWMEILEDKDTPSEMKEGMRALQRLFPKDGGVALLAKFCAFFNSSDNDFQFNENGSVSFTYIIDYSYYKKATRSKSMDLMISFFNYRKNVDLVLLWGSICTELLSKQLVKNNMRYFYADEIRNWMKIESNQELLKFVTSINLFKKRKLEERFTMYDGLSMRTIPPEIIYLPNLKEIRANVRSDDADYPGVYLIHLPSEVCELNNLEILELCGNGLTELPSNITNLKNLRKIDLSRNRLNFLVHPLSSSLFTLAKKTKFN